MVLELIIPHVSLHKWDRGGKSTLGPMFMDGTLKPFGQLQREFHIRTSDHYSYLQRSHFLKSLTSSEILIHKQGW